jgi:hypothetical protein
MTSLLDTIFTTADVALVYGITRARVQQLASKNGIGTLLRGQRYRLFTREDIIRFGDVRKDLQHYRCRKKWQKAQKLPGKGSCPDPAVQAIMAEQSAAGRFD